MQDESLAKVEELARSGQPEAIHNLCYRFKYGERAAPDLVEAKHWCSLGAELGLNSSQVLLAEMYYTGAGVPKDLTLALHWYQEAAARNHPHAMYLLYYFYSNGIGVDPDRKLALGYLQRAANQGHTDAIKALESLSTGR